MWFWKRKQGEPSIKLDTVGAWEISAPRTGDAFFPALLELLPESTNLVLEDVFGDEVIAFLRTQRIEPAANVNRGTVWPLRELFHIRLNAHNMQQLVSLYDRHNRIELFIHFQAYHNGKVLLSWYDAWYDPIYISPIIPEDAVKRFCQAVGSKYQVSQDRVETLRVI